MMAVANDKPRILLTGATGYVGGRLLKALEAQGYPVRCLSRRPDALQSRRGTNTEVVYGDVLKPQTLAAALEGIDMAYYMVHSMSAGADFRERDRRAAADFAEAARAAGVQRIIYLGGLGEGDHLSAHLASRHEVGRILRESGVPTIEFRASIIIGSASLSFEMIRALVDRLPIMVTPRWVKIRAQPIAIEDVLAYLIEALTIPQAESAVFEIGGRDRASYGEIMRAYARARGLRRWMIPVPVLTPRLSSLWLSLVTPLYARVGRKLIDSIRNETVVHDPRASEVFRIHPRGLPEAIERALINEDEQFAATRWSDALSTDPTARSSWKPSYGGVRFGSRVVDSRVRYVPVEPRRAFAPVRRIGGKQGWYYANLLWQIRGLIDQLIGGVGLRRGRRDPETVVPGDTIDFWRVEAFEPNRLLRLSAEMKVPGRAWLQFEVEPDVPGVSLHDAKGTDTPRSASPAASAIRQTAIFDPRGLAGLLYWYALYPLHALIFAGMLKRIARKAAHEPDTTESSHAHDPRLVSH